jgi:hypothetical protein
VLALLVPFVGTLGFFVGQFSSRSGPASAISARVITAAVERPVEEPRQAQFRWVQLETEDINDFIVNLRATGCPESTIADIARGRILAAYQARVNAIFDPLAQYWTAASEKTAIDEQIKGIRKERNDVLASLGLNGPDDENELGLSQEKQHHVSEALRQFPKDLPSPSAPAEQWSKALDRRKDRIKYLSQFLSSDELLTYRITQDGNSFGVGQITRDIKLSDNEFRRVFEALDGENLNMTNYFLPPAVEERLKHALGPERYSEYREQIGPENFSFNLFVRSSNLTDEQIQRLKELRPSADSMAPGAYHEAVVDILHDRSLASRYLTDPHVWRVTPK